MELYSIIGIGIIAAILAVVLRQLKPEYALFSSLMAGIVILLAIISNASPIIEGLGKILSATNLPTQYVSILFKALGICYITQLACDTCRDAGENAIAGKIELSGRIAIILISLPLFEEVLKIAGSFLGL